MTREEVLEMRGMRRKEILDYFTRIGGQDSGCGKFSGQNWEVEVSEENFIMFGSIKIPSTVVLFRGDDQTIEELITSFRFKFLSAGG